MKALLVLAVLCTPLTLSSCQRESSPAPAASANPAPSQLPSTPAPAAAPAPAATAAAASAAPAATPDQLMGSCSIQGVACSDYYGAPNPTVQKACAGVGTWKTSACPAAGSVGTCTRQEVPGVVNRTHSYPPGTAATAKKACDNTPGGVFSTP
jgi:pyruvate dehydrogenase E2 component (dihydrolipoamide acetyltransferase)